MPKKQNKFKRLEILDALADYVSENGLYQESINKLASGVGVSPRMLIHYFGSVAAMREEIMRVLRKRSLLAGSRLSPETLRTPEDFLSFAGEHLTQPDQLKLMKTFFELFGIAVNNPKEYGDFARNAVEDYFPALIMLTRIWGVPPHRQETVATTVLAIARGLLMDMTATGDRDRILSATAWVGEVLTREVKK